jgi:hypothetical protein
MSKAPSTKIAKVAGHLVSRKTITSWKAIELYQATRLADIIFTLKRQGWDISTTMRYEPDGTRYAVYRLISYPKQGDYCAI